MSRHLYLSTRHQLLDETTPEGSEVQIIVDGHGHPVIEVWSETDEAGRWLAELAARLEADCDGRGFYARAWFEVEKPRPYARTTSSILVVREGYEGNHPRSVLTIIAIDHPGRRR